MPVIYGALDLAKNELRNAVAQNLGSAPSTPLKGQIYMDSTGNNLMFYDGTAWVSCRSVGALTPAASVTNSAVGDAAVTGVSTNYARQDHAHGREAFAAVTVETTFGSASANGSAATLARSDHAHGNPAHNAAAHSAISLSALAVPTGSLNLGGFVVNNVGQPVTNTDVANKQYVDNVSWNTAWKDSVRLATTASLGASIPNSLVAVDGVTPVSGDRILVKNQATPAQNGIYTAANSTWQRSYDTQMTVNAMVGAAMFVEEGTANADTAWVCTTNAPITLDTTPIAFVQFGASTTYTAGAGLTLTAGTIDVVAGDTSLTVNPDSMIVNTAVIASRAYADSAASTATTGMAKKFAAALTGTASPETVTHNLNSRDIALTVYNGATPYTAVEVDWDATTVNTAVVRYNPNLGAGYRVVVFG